MSFFMCFNMSTIEWVETGDSMKWIETGWVNDKNGLRHYGSRSARKSHIIFHRDFGLRRVEALGRRMSRGGW